MTGAVAIFVKTPGYSAVKTRLAAVAGEAFAREWHRRAAHTVAAVAGAAATASGVALYWAVAEPGAIADGVWADLPNLSQGEGGLGARMGRVHGELVQRHGYGILLGADTPQLGVSLVRDAVSWLAAPVPRQVLGPARDGGFWLYGGNRATALPAWEAVPYSRSDTAARFQVAFGDRGAWLVLPKLTDVDHAEDVPAMRDELATVPAPLPAQQQLHAWLQEVRIPGVLPEAAARD